LSIELDIVKIFIDNPHYEHSHRRNTLSNLFNYTDGENDSLRPALITALWGSHSFYTLNSPLLFTINFSVDASP